MPLSPGGGSATAGHPHPNSNSHDRSTQLRMVAIPISGTFATQIHDISM